MTPVAINEDVLRARVQAVLVAQGLSERGHSGCSMETRDLARDIQRPARLEQIAKRERFIRSNTALARRYCADGRHLDPARIQPELRVVSAGSEEEILFRWWNLCWWSIPYQPSYGRQMRYLVWDKGHDCVMGLLCLQSPVLRMAARDQYLGIQQSDVDYWVNQSMSASRVGAIPPYNDLIGGKLVAMAATSNEVRREYTSKYSSRLTVMEQRLIPPRLLFITTTSAFGRSSIYNRLKMGGESVAMHIGATQGAGSFQVPDWLYHELLEYLDAQGMDVGRGYGHGPSRKMHLIATALGRLGLPASHYHGIRRELFLMPLVENLSDVISGKSLPRWVDRPFDELSEYWKTRWCLPRSIRCPGWHTFDAATLFDEQVPALLFEARSLDQKAEQYIGGEHGSSRIERGSGST